VNTTSPREVARVDVAAILSRTANGPIIAVSIGEQDIAL
jgi:hypothetical protein